MPPLFDMRLRALRRDRAALVGPELFLFERAFEDCLERIALIQRRFAKALLIGCPDAGWPDRLRELAGEVDALDPGPLFATAAVGREVVEDEWQPEAGPYDLVLTIGTLDTVDDLPTALLTIRFALRRDSLFIGTLPGGDTLPLLRSAMRAADEVMGAATPHVHPRIEPAGLSSLLTSAGYAMPVVDVDRVHVTYAGFRDLVRDLRAMGATNILSARSRRPLSRAAIAAADRHFASAAREGRSTETFELLHFAAWTPSDPANG